MCKILFWKETYYATNFVKINRSNFFMLEKKDKINVHGKSSFNFTKGLYTQIFETKVT